MQKILSIIIPTYNMEKYLDKCLASLVVRDRDLHQLLEVLVIIDGATDGSSSIAHSYQMQYPEIFRVIDKENGNYGSCINIGLKLATSKYVKVLDADDSFDTNNFEDYLRFLCGVEADMIITPYMEVNEDGTECRRISYDLQGNTLLSWKQLTPAFKKRSLQMHAVTYKLQNIKDIHYKQTEGISYTDQEWIFTPLTTVNTAIAYPDTIYKYLLGREGQTVNPAVLKKNISQNEQCCRRIINDYKSFGLFEPHKQAYIDYKFRVTLIAMYKWYLVDYQDLDIMQLVKFDDFVRTVDASYIDMLNEEVLEYTKYHYIREWHKKRSHRIYVHKLYSYYAHLMSKIYQIVNE